MIKQEGEDRACAIQCGAVRLWLRYAVCLVAVVPWYWFEVVMVR